MDLPSPSTSELHQGASFTKKRWPKFIADQLGLPEVLGKGGPWHSSGDTIDKVWFERMSEALNIPYAGSRVLAMKALIEAVGEEWDADSHSSEMTDSKGGGDCCTDR